MIGDLEYLLQKDEAWKSYERLYHHVKSAIFYSAGLQGKFNSSVHFNIETLVNTLYELERNEYHPIYPFIASWNSRFLSLAGQNFEQIEAFRGLILEKLKSWVCPEDSSKADYYSGIRTIQQQLNFPLRIFTLNYDLCVEGTGTEKFRIETGFAGSRPDCFWDHERFDDSPPSGDPRPEVFLYKLHGSINWKRDAEKRLYQVQQVLNVESQAMELIFGREFKLEAADPYLFYAYEFREYTNKAKLILALGYGFGDAHINKLLSQALRRPGGPNLAVVGLCENEAEMMTYVEETLDVKGQNKVTVTSSSIREWLSGDDVGERVLHMIPKEEDPFEGA